MLALLVGFLENYFEKWANKNITSPIVMWWWAKRICTILQWHSQSPGSKCRPTSAYRVVARTVPARVSFIRSLPFTCHFEALKEHILKWKDVGNKFFEPCSIGTQVLIQMQCLIDIVNAHYYVLLLLRITTYYYYYMPLMNWPLHEKKSCETNQHTSNLPF